MSKSRSISALVFMILFILLFKLYLPIIPVAPVALAALFGGAIIDTREHLAPGFFGVAFLYLLVGTLQLIFVEGTAIILYQIVVLLADTVAIVLFGFAGYVLTLWD